MLFVKHQNSAQAFTKYDAAHGHSIANPALVCEINFGCWLLWVSLVDNSEKKNVIDLAAYLFTCGKLCMSYTVLTEFHIYYGLIILNALVNIWDVKKKLNLDVKNEHHFFSHILLYLQHSVFTHLHPSCAVTCYIMFPL